MFTPGSILHGIFHLKAITKPKYAIVLYNDGINCILTIFTTSEERSGVISPIHGKNPQDSEPLSYVFKKGVIVGELSNKGTVVPCSFFLSQRYGCSSRLRRPIHYSTGFLGRSHRTDKMRRTIPL